MRLLSLVLTILTCPAMAIAQSGQFHGRTPLGPDFEVLTVRTSDGDQLNIHMRIDEVDGVYVLCIASSGRENEDNEELKSYQLIVLNDEIIMRGTDWAPHYRNPNGRQAVCQKTRARIVANPRFETRWAQYDF